MANCPRLARQSGDWRTMEMYGNHLDSQLSIGLSGYRWMDRIVNSTLAFFKKKIPINLSQLAIRYFVTSEQWGDTKGSEIWKHS